MPTYPIRRRPRECKTCLPCRDSKIRCDRNVPCGSCVKRDQADRCAYGRPPPPPPKPSVLPPPPSVSSLHLPRTAGVPNHDVDGLDPTTAVDSRNNSQDAVSDSVDLSQAEWDEICSKMNAMEQILASLRSIFRLHSARPALSDSRADGTPARQPTSPQPDEGVYESNVQKTGAVHLGSRAALVDILDNSKTSEEIAQALPKGDLLAELALGNEAASYPFVDLWSSDPFTFNIAAVCAVLPDDQQCQRFLGFYRDIGAVLYPVLPDVSRLEQDMNQLLHNRRLAGGVYRPDTNGLVKPFGMSVAFLSLLFAVLASGCQLSDLPGNDRELTSWVYISCSYQCLRVLNYVSQPTVEVIQILLIISNVLSYNMNAGASYTLLGMTERMCMVLGLHVDSTEFTRAEQDVRRRVWWAMAFQNSHFSLAYDRPSITMISQPEIPFDRKSMPGHRSYFETLCRIVSLALEVLRSRLLPCHSHMRYHEIRELKQRIQRILSEATPHLRFREHCVTLAEHIERTELRLHSSYLTSVLCRPSLDPYSHLDDQRRTILREECVSSLVGTIEAFVELHLINPHTSRSWISLQRTIASAFLLVATEDGQSHPQTWDLIEKLEMVLADHVYADGAPDQNNRTDSAKHLASSLRSLREVSAAFRARKSGTSNPVTTTSAASTPGMWFPSPASTEASPVAPSRLLGNLVNGDWHMRNILDRVSDVMLFPSLGSMDPAVI